jgi:hypothetical protein
MWAWPYGSIRLRADLAVTLLLIFCTVNFIDILNSAVDLVIYTNGLAAQLEGTHNFWAQQRNGFVALWWLVLAFPGSVIAVSMWVHRAYRNLVPLGTANPKASPSMAVAWFYIPVANLWKPLGVMREIWSATMGDGSSRLIGIWWACWLLGIVVGTTQAVFSFRETAAASSHILPLLLSFVSDITWNVAALLLVKMILDVTNAQESAHQTDR